MPGPASRAPGGSRASTEICPACARRVLLTNWACPRCGHILDAYLLGTITSKSVGGEERVAFKAGYIACNTQFRQSGSVEIEHYRPVPGHETAYRAGWARAAERIRAKTDRRQGRKQGLILILVGLLSLALGIAILVTIERLFGSRGHVDGGGLMAIGALMLTGLVNLVIGIVCLLTGEDSDVTFSGR